MRGLLLACALALAAWPGRAADVEQRFVTIGTDSVTSSYYAAGGAVCRMVNRARESHGLRCAVEPTGGSVYNLNTIRSGELDFGIVRSDRSFEAQNGAARFEAQSPFTELRAVFALHSEPLTVLVRADSAVRRFADLRYRRIALADPLSSARLSTQAVLAAFGWTAVDDVDTGAGPLCDGRVGALAFTAAHPSAAVRQAFRCDLRVLPVTGRSVDQVLAEYPYYRRAEVPGGLYPGNPAYAASMGPGAVLMTSTAMPEEAVHALVRSVFGDFARFHRLHPTLYHLRAEDMATRGYTAPLHPGALRYYREQGWR
ncbi:MAG: hypothetical protein TEF_08235 [Rhizobiales bacterium NRL2]|jgi:hypothetical protein|nr:MAG: hypothetical protein TEF_08235 [Rhizobiales bacterium NRL2]